MNAERQSVIIFLGTTNIWEVSSTFEKSVLRLVFPSRFLVAKKATFEKGRVPRGLTQPRAGRPLRGNTVCLEPLLLSTKVMATST